MKTPSKTNRARHVSWKFGSDIAKLVMSFEDNVCPPLAKKNNKRVFDHSTKRRIEF